MPRKHTAKHRDNLRWAGAVVAFGHKQNRFGPSGRSKPCGDGSGRAENACKATFYFREFEERRGRRSNRAVCYREGRIRKVGRVI